MRMVSRVLPIALTACGRGTPEPALQHFGAGMGRDTQILRATSLSNGASTRNAIQIPLDSVKSWQALLFG